MKSIGLVLLKNVYRRVAIFLFSECRHRYLAVQNMYKCCLYFELYWLGKKLTLKKSSNATHKKISITFVFHVNWQVKLVFPSLSWVFESSISIWFMNVKILLTPFSSSTSILLKKNKHQCEFIFDACVYISDEDVASDVFEWCVK